LCVNAGFCGFLSCDFVAGVSCDFCLCFGWVLIGVLLAGVCVNFVSSSTSNNVPVAKNVHLLFSRPLSSHDDMTWALALAVAHCMQMPSPGVGAAMLPPSEKIPPLEKVKPLSSAPFWQAFISKIQQDHCQASE